jgi:hypothetical protein
MTVSPRHLAAIASALLLAACATPGGDKTAWSCSANGLVSAQYNGSSHAYIHLSGFSSGGQYAVKLNDAKTEATGVTANGTPFKCVKPA